MQTVVPGLLGVNRKSWKIKNTHGRTCNIGRNNQKCGK